uniref:Pyruvoyl-dependent arginine decarboxylase AaxB n=1 Tax=candidate division WOR-3 bacterium TaxID=2052148 RepID=A0A7C3J5F7_UNCW3
MNLFTPKRFFFVAGHSEGFSKLNSFDCALLNAKIGNMNLIKISSIIPPYCKNVKFIKIPQGSFIPVAYASITSDMTGQYISAGVAAAKPDDDSLPGVIMEYSSNGRKKDIEQIVRSMAEEAMRVRGVSNYSLSSKATEHRVKRIGTAFAAVVLWE